MNSAEIAEIYSLDVVKKSTGKMSYVYISLWNPKNRLY